MENTFSLPDFEAYKKCNSHFISHLDYISLVIRGKKAHSDLIFAVQELIWPTFIVHKDFVFLKYKFDLERFENESSQKNPELWHNFTSTFFFDNDEEEVEKAEALRSTLLTTWKTKLALEFPDRKFIVFPLEEAFGEDEIGISFYQEKNLNQFYN